jgi:hypothetical protein
LIGGEIEQAGIVFGVGLLKQAQQLGVDVRLGAGLLQAIRRFDAAILGHAQEDNAIDCALYGVVEFVDGELGIAQREVTRQRIAPAFDLFQEFRIDGGGAALAFGVLHILVERAAAHRFAGKHVPDFLPAIGVFVEHVEIDTRHAGLIFVERARATIIHGQFFKVRQ